MDKSAHEEHLSQPIQTDNKQLKIAITFLTGYNGIFNVTNSNYKFYFTRSINDDDFSVVCVSRGAYEIESLNNEIKSLIIVEEHFTEADYPFTIKPIFSISLSFMEISRLRSLISFLLDDSVRNLSGFII